MNTEMGEYLVGAYLKLKEECQYVDYNVRPPGGKLRGLEELDVIGLDIKRNRAFVCEVTTHINGLLYGSSYVATVERINQKFDRQKKYAKDYLESFKEVQFSLWSPVVGPSLLKELQKINGLELIVNEIYAERIDALRTMASKETYDTRNPAFRLLQILEHLRGN